MRMLVGFVTADYNKLITDYQPSSKRGWGREQERGICIRMCKKQK